MLTLLSRFVRYMDAFLESTHPGKKSKESEKGVRNWRKIYKDTKSLKMCKNSDKAFKILKSSKGSESLKKS